MTADLERGNRCKPLLQEWNEPRSEENIQGDRILQSLDHVEEQILRAFFFWTFVDCVDNQVVDVVMLKLPLQQVNNIFGSWVCPQLRVSDIGVDDGIGQFGLAMHELSEDTPLKVDQSVLPFVSEVEVDVCKPHFLVMRVRLLLKVPDVVDNGRCHSGFPRTGNFWTKKCF